MKRIYIKTEPAGEIGLGKLSEEDIKLFKSLKNSGDLKDSLFVEAPFDLCEQSAYGVFIGSEDTIDGELPKYECIETISLLKDGSYEDGWYIVHTGLTKGSLEFQFEPEGGDFDINELVIEYQKVNLSELSDDLYGELNFNVLSNILYKGDFIDEYDEAELIDRGIDREVHILQIKDEKINTVYKNRNYLEEY
jgi:hypothetical protein|tara:strand:+ start:3355 stop:3933 length:579 start_codon:yes stop_codon:yes gene_type:complete